MSDVNGTLRTTTNRNGCSMLNNKIVLLDLWLTFSLYLGIDGSLNVRVKFNCSGCGGGNVNTPKRRCS